MSIRIATDRLAIDGGSPLVTDLPERGLIGAEERAAVLGVAGGATILFAVHLFMKECGSGLPTPKINGGIVNSKGVELDIKGGVFQRKMQVQLKKGF